jgi:hypothetical protein
MLSRTVSSGTSGEETSSAGVRWKTSKVRSSAGSDLLVVLMDAVHRWESVQPPPKKVEQATWPDDAPRFGVYDPHRDEEVA